MRRMLAELEEAAPGQARPLAFALLDLKRADAVAKAPACMGYAVELDAMSAALRRELAVGAVWRVRDLAVRGADVIRERGVEPGPGGGHGARAAPRGRDGRRGAKRARGPSRLAEVGRGAMRRRCRALAGPAQLLRIFRLHGRALSRIVFPRAERRTKWQIGTSSSGRTADSGSVNGSSTLSVPANSAACLTIAYVARSSSGSGRRPLKAEITSSNLVRATKWPVRLAVQDAALSRRRSPVRIWYGATKRSGSRPAGCGPFSYGAGTTG